MWRSVRRSSALVLSALLCHRTDARSTLRPRVRAVDPGTSGCSTNTLPRRIPRRPSQATSERVATRFALWSRLMAPSRGSRHEPRMCSSASAQPHWSRARRMQSRPSCASASNPSAWLCTTKDGTPSSPTQRALPRPMRRRTSPLWIFGLRSRDGARLSRGSLLEPFRARSPSTAVWVWSRTTTSNTVEAFQLPG